MPTRLACQKLVGNLPDESPGISGTFWFLRLKYRHSSNLGNNPRTLARGASAGKSNPRWRRGLVQAVPRTQPLLPTADPL